MALNLRILVTEYIRASENKKFPQTPRISVMIDLVSGEHISQLGGKTEQNMRWHKDDRRAKKKE